MKLPIAVLLFLSCLTGPALAGSDECELRCVTVFGDAHVCIIVHGASE